MSRTRRRPGVRVGIVVLVLMALLGGAYLVGYRVNLQTQSVPLPGASATPDQVVMTYVDAYNYRDFTTLDTIYPAMTGAHSRLRAMGTLRDVEITRSYAASAEDMSGKHPKVGHDYAIVGVVVNFTGLTGSDLALAPGRNGWNYWLERSDPGQPWTIIDSGNG